MSASHRLLASRVSFVRAVAIAAGLGAGPVAGASARGVVIEEVRPGGAFIAAGLRPGDMLVRWERDPAPPVNPAAASGVFASPFDVDEVELEQSPRGPVRVEALRDGLPLAFELPASEWQVVARPALDALDLLAYEDARARLAAGEVEAGLERLRALASRPRADLAVACWLWLRVATEAGKAGHDADATRALDAAERVAAQLPPNVGGAVAQARGDALVAAGRIADAEPAFAQAAALHERHRPGGLAVAAAWRATTPSTFAAQGLDATDDLFARALALEERQAPESWAVAATLVGRGSYAGWRGDPDTVERHARQALRIAERLVPEGRILAAALELLASSEQWLRGRPSQALPDFERVVALRERLDPKAPELPQSLAGLALTLGNLGDLAAAARIGERALAIVSANAPNNVLVSTLQHNLAGVRLRQGQAGEARRLYALALDTLERLSPNSPNMATFLLSLATVCAQLDDKLEAQRLTRRALELAERRPEQVRPIFLLSAGHLALQYDDVDGAHGLFQRLLGYESLRGTLDEAWAQHGLGRVARRRALGDQALTHSLAAVELVESWRRRVSAAPDRQALLASRFADIYRDHVDLLVDLGKPEEAWAWLERSRGQALAALLEERTGARGGAPLDLGGAQQALDPGTLLLAYSTGEERTLLFAVGRGEASAAHAFAVFPLALTRRALEAQVKELRGLLSHTPEQADQARLVQLGRELFRALVAPARDLITRHRRLALSPDGPLHALPFAALLGAPQPGARESRLVEWRPLHVVPSAAVYAELRAARRTARAAEGAPALAAFGDPDYTRAPAQGAPLGTRGWLPRAAGGIEPLPASRREVQDIAGLFAARDARTFLGQAASEGNAREHTRDARFVHFACHAFFDETTPLGSALVLSLPDRPRDAAQDGLLEAREVLEQLKVDADLVTLSACETGLGQEVSGEGLVGLARAFQVAGARSVLASLWRVGDESTARLMTRFYRHLSRGASQDEALRRAQIELLRGRFRAPFHWAAFQLNGDGW